MVITLNETEQRLVKHLAERRYQYCRTVRAQATRYHEQAALEAEVDAIGAEIAYCKVMNCYPDLEHTQFNPDDMLRRDGQTIDVKQTHYPNGKLLVKVKEREQLPDQYALMVGRFPAYRLAGHIAASEMIREERIDHSLPVPAYAAGQAELR
jgi:hypothetical protein